jgi:hypothetical protein
LNPRLASSLLGATGSLALGTVLFATDACTVMGTAGPSDAGSATQAPDACNQCLAGDCLSSWSVCANDQDCMAIFNCATQPACEGDQACVDACRADRPMPARQAYYALALCDLESRCSACDARCGSLPSTFDCSRLPSPPSSEDAGATRPAGDAGDGGDAVDAGASASTDAEAPDGAASPEVRLTCDACTAAQCATEKAACASGTQCADYTQLVAQCASGPSARLAECLDEVETAFPDGARASTSLSGCVAAHCRGDCGL